MDWVHRVAVRGEASDRTVCLSRWDSTEPAHEQTGLTGPHVRGLERGVRGAAYPDVEPLWPCFVTLVATAHDRPWQDGQHLGRFPDDPVPSSLPWQPFVRSRGRHDPTRARPPTRTRTRIGNEPEPSPRAGRHNSFERFAQPCPAEECRRIVGGHSRHFSGVRRGWRGCLRGPCRSTPHAASAARPPASPPLPPPAGSRTGTRARTRPRDRRSCTGPRPGVRRPCGRACRSP